MPRLRPFHRLFSRPRFLAKRRAGGSVLALVILVMLALVSVAVIFSTGMYQAYRSADNRLAGEQAELAIEGAARYVEYLMTQVPRPGAMPDPATFGSGPLAIGEATVWFIGSPLATGSNGLGGGAENASNGSGENPAFGLIDEAGKLNINTASAEMLAALPNMTPEIATQITAWRGGGEGGTVLAEGNPKGAAFESVEELALVTGTDLGFLYGNDTNFNHVTDLNEEALETTLVTGDPDHTVISGLLEYVTVFSREPDSANSGGSGSGRGGSGDTSGNSANSGGSATSGSGSYSGQTVNVAQGWSDAMEQLLTQTLGADRAGEIGQRLRGGDNGRVNSVLAFYVRSGMSEQEFDQVAPHLTARSGAAPGLVNVNTASAAVLACIPGIGPDKAPLLVAQRASLGEAPASLAWVVPVLGNESAIAAGPYLTANSYQICADIAAVGRGGRGYRRVRFIIDNSTGTPRIIYRRNLTHLGWALGPAARETLTQRSLTREGQKDNSQ